MTARLIVADVFEGLDSLPEGSVDLVFTSPPFLALRSYLPRDHPDKEKEIGSESTPGEFIDTMLDVVEACARVLAPHGSLCFELGDTFSGSGGAGGDYNEGGPRAGQPTFRQKPLSPGPKYQGVANEDGRRSRAADEEAGILQPRPRGGPGQRDSIAGWPLDKSLALIPELFRVALAYGVNPLTGRETEPWRIRNVVRWHRPNPPVGALADKFRPATSDVVIACKSRTRYFDLDAVRGNPEDVKDQRVRSTNGPKQGADPAEVLTANYHERVPSHPNGAPPLDTWIIPTAPYQGSHYATFPPALVVKPVLAMCPEKVCTACGEPRRRIAETVNALGKASRRNRDMANRKDVPVSSTYFPDRADRLTLGWTDCGHDSWGPGLVLDPFAGSGTTLAVATGHGRDAIGIDIDGRNAELALNRVGPFILTVEHLAVACA